MPPPRDVEAPCFACGEQSTHYVCKHCAEFARVAAAMGRLSPEQTFEWLMRDGGGVLCDPYGRAVFGVDGVQITAGTNGMRAVLTAFVIHRPLKPAEPL